MSPIILKRRRPLSPAPISGAEAYALYTAAILPLRHASGGEVVLEAAAADWFIGPEAEVWHKVLIVRQASLAAFFAFASDPAAQAAGVHRAAALADSRLLPMRAELEGCTGGLDCRCVLCPAVPPT